MGGERILDEAERLGATHLGNGVTRFVVWAPAAERVEVVVGERTISLERGSDGYHRGEGSAGPGDAYHLRLDGRESLPDPASRHQPDGIHGPSGVVDLSRHPWNDGSWKGIDLADYVVYELHVGTFTPEGTLDAVIPRLPDLVDLGVTAIEPMPVAQFPGRRNWGYDGVFPSAVQESYGGPEAYARFVDACHASGLAVVQDVVYNHIGPEGNVLPRFGPYFTDAYRTPWGEALNLDGAGSDEVRRFFLESALWFLRDLHVDALRLDAIQGIVDTTARPFLLELSEMSDALAERTGRRLHLLAETDANDPRVVSPRDEGGLGIHAMWNDDFHHALHALLTGERGGYYMDFGSPEDLVAAMREGFVLAGRRSEYRRRRHGAPSDRVPAHRLVVYAQNHDQVGNRPRGRRLARLLSFDQEKLVAGVVLLSPYLPLLFMGEEYGEPAPFHYFVSHSDEKVIESVRRGRRLELAAFAWREEPPDPQEVTTFEASKLDWALRDKGEHAALLALHRELLRLRREHPALANRSKRAQTVTLEGRVLAMRRRSADGGWEASAVFNLSPEPAAAPGRGTIFLHSADERWAGPGVPTDGGLPPYAFLIVERRG